MTETQKSCALSYAKLLNDFLDGRLTASKFEPLYLRKFKDEKTILPDAVFNALDEMFAEADAYVADPALRGVKGIGDEELKAAARVALTALSKGT